MIKIHAHHVLEQIFILMVEYVKYAEMDNMLILTKQVAVVVLHHAQPVLQKLHVLHAIMEHIYQLHLVSNVIQIVVVVLLLQIIVFLVNQIIIWMAPIAFVNIIYIIFRMSFEMLINL